MNKFLSVLYIICSILLLVYVSYPSPQFPSQIPNSVQSFEPADVEDPLRRGYYTDATRNEVMAWYQKEFGWGYKLNYRVEEAPIIIRDQTKSTFLEEIVHPFRESIFINGFEPKSEEYKLIIDGRQWRQKIIVKMVESNVFYRFAISLLTLAGIFVLVREYRYVTKN